MKVRGILQCSSEYSNQPNLYLRDSFAEYPVYDSKHGPITSDSLSCLIAVFAIAPVGIAGHVCVHNMHREHFAV